MRVIRTRQKVIVPMPWHSAILDLGGRLAGEHLIGAVFMTISALCPIGWLISSLACKCGAGTHILAKRSRLQRAGHLEGRRSKLKAALIHQTWL